MSKKKVLLIGPFVNISGYSDHARLIADALLAQKDKFEVYMLCTQWARASSDSSFGDRYGAIFHHTHQYLQSSNQANTPTHTLFDCSLQIRPPNEFEKITNYDIGVTAALETTKAPTEWIDKCNMMNKLLVVSSHSKNNLEAAKNPETGQVITTPIEIIPFYNTITGDEDSFSGYNSVDTSINFLTVSQMAPRKNFYNLLKWFCEEFKDNEDVGLIVKLHHLNNSVLDRHHVQNYIRQTLTQTGLSDKKCKIHLLHGNLTEGEMRSLYQKDFIRGYITTTHGEGFGVPLFNAVCSDIPVVAPAWSGHLDFLSAPYTNTVSGKSKVKNLFLKTKFDIKPVKDKHLMPGLITKECEWCYVDERSFKKNLQILVKTPTTHQENAQILGEHIRNTFSKETVFQKCVDSLKDVPTSAVPAPTFDIEVNNMFNAISGTK